MIIGFHVSTSKGFDKALYKSLEYDGNTFQFFPRNPRGSKSRNIKEEELEIFKNLVQKEKFGPVVCHGSYTMNLASSNKSVINNTKSLMKADFEKIEKLGIRNYILHPGSHTGQGEQKGLDLIINGLNEVLSKEYKFNLCLETMSGKGTELGYKFEQIDYIIKNINYDNIGVCLDTCHIYSAGYDIRTNLNKVMSEFDRVLGYDKIKILHLNDSKTEFNSRKDRHEIIGEGSLGIQTFKNIVNSNLFENIPIILETPNDFDGYKKEINLLKRLRK